MYPPPTNEERAKQITAKILESESLQSVWRKYYYSERNEDPMEDMAGELLDDTFLLSENPKTLTFMYELINVHIGALSRAPQKDIEAHDLKNKLQDVADYLVNVTYPTTLLDETELNKDQQRIIEAIEKQTNQGPGAIKEFWNSVKKGTRHVYEDSKEFAQEHPKTATITAAIPIAAVGFSYINYTPPQKTEIDPSVTAFDNYADDIMNIVESSDSFSYNPDEVITEAAFGCHDHLEQLVSPVFFGWEKFTSWETPEKDTAELLVNTFNLDTSDYEHCSYIANQIYDANAMAQAIKESWHIRLDATILEPIEHVVTNTIPESTWRDTLLTSMTHTHDFFKAGNDFENALHPLIAAAVAISVYKFGTKGLGELKETFNHTVDFGRRSAAVPLNFLLMAGGSAYAYTANNSFTEAIIGAAVGTLAGELIHNTQRKLKSPDFAKNSLITASKDLTSFSDQNKIVSNEMASGEVVDTSLEKNSFNKWVNTKTAATAAITTTALAIDGLATGGKLSASVAGAIAVGAPDLLYNLFEDPSLHVIFGVAGAIIGGTGAALKWGGRGIKHLANRDKDDDNDPSL